MSSNVQYVLYVDNSIIPDIMNTLSGAQALARTYAGKMKSLRIQTVDNSSPIPSPDRIWNFDYEINKWVEKI